MKNKISLIRFLKKWGSFLIVSIILLVLSFDIANTYFRYKAIEKKIKTEYLSGQKASVKAEVDRIVDLLNIQQRQLKSFSSRLLRTRVYQAEAVAEQLYSIFKAEGKNDKFIKTKITEAIKGLRRDVNSDYYFIVDKKGNIFLHGGNPELNGVNIFSSDKYAESRKIFAKFIEAIKDSGEGIVEYYWLVPKTNRREYKIAFVKLFKPFNWIIGTGIYLYESEKVLQENITQFVNNYRFGKSKKNYIFILRLLDINGGKNFAQMYVNPNRPDLIGKFLHDDYKDAKGKQFRKEFLKGLREKGEAFVKYWYKKLGSEKLAPKISYFKLTENKKFIVAAGFYLDEMEAEIAQINEELISLILKRSVISLIVTVIILVIYFFLLNRFLSRIKIVMDLFTSFFRNAVKKNNPIDLNKIPFTELKPLAEEANKMLEAKKKAEDELRKEKEMLFVTMQSVGDGLISTDAEGRVAFLNRVAEKLTGWTNEEARGKELTEIFNIINEETRERVENPVMKVLSEGKIVGLANHTLLVSKNGEEYNIADSAAPIKDKDGNILGVVLVFRDVTNEYRIIRELRKNEEMNSAILSALPDAIFIIDKENKFVSYVSNDPRLLYVPPEEFIGKDLRDVLPPSLSSLTAEHVKRVLETAESRSFEYQLEINGEVKYFEARLTLKGKDEVLVIVRDISEKKKTEMELQASEEKFRKLSLLKKAILESPHGIIVFALDKEYRYLDFTSLHKQTMRMIWGADIEIGKNMLDYITKEEDRLAAKKNFDRALKGESFILVEEYGDEKFKRTFYENRYSPVYDENNEIVGVSVYVIDITERIRAQKLAEKMLKEVEEKAEELKEKNEELIIAKEKAEASEKIKTEFLTQVSHEIRSPLNVIVNFVSLIKDEMGAQDDEFISTAFAGIDSASRRIIRTIELILNMSELQLGTYKSAKRNFDFADKLMLITQEYQQSAKIKGIRLSLEVECENKIIFNDDYAFNQIFANLIDNAIKYTDKGFVRIVAKCDEHKVEIKVVDTGIGISEDYLPILFEPFTQEEQGYHRKFDGNGLGMALIKRYSEIMDADIRVESKKGFGTTFTVILGRNLK